MSEKKRQKKAKKKAKKKSPWPRITWTRSPVQRPHSTKKGRKGYDRRRRKQEERKAIGEQTE